MDSWVPAVDLEREPRLADLELPAAITADMLGQAASEKLWAWSGRQFGVTTRTVRPAPMVERQGCGVEYGWGWGQAVTVPPFTFSAGSASVELLHAISVTEVRVDGVVLSPSAYALRGEHLWRTDGQVWPVQSLTVPDGAVGSWSVTYSSGIPVPASGVLAARELAVHIGLNLCGKPSKLPNRATSANRQGVSVNLLPPDPKTGRMTGLPLVDEFVLAMNPTGRSRRPVIASPDLIVGVA